MNPSRDELHPHLEEIRPAFRQYIESVSSRSMALPIETCAYLLWACRYRRATDVCDLGSGLTSWVLRHYATTAPYTVFVHSVDDNDYWLRRSRAFMEYVGMSQDGFVSGDDWVQMTRRYDVIVHDYSGGAVRDEFMGYAADRLKPDGWLILDDMQHYGHHFRADQVAREHGLALVDIWAQTIDEIGRYAGLMVAPPDTVAAAA